MKPKIAVIGVGGAGGNAVNNMIESNLEGVEFWVTNTDAQALDNSLTDNRIQLGVKCTQGLGAGSHPEIGSEAAEESLEDIRAAIKGCNMLFITAGMGGGTGTGAAPVIARVAREEGLLVVGVVTKPFHFEGVRRMNIADSGLEALSRNVDTLIIIPNQNLFRIANENTTFSDAFKMADNVLHSGVRGVTDLITIPGLINLDFADIKSVMSEMGKAMMGTGEAEGENRALRAAEDAISNPLLDISSMRGAKGVLINITGGSDMTLFEVDAAANRIREEVADDANIIFGSAFNAEIDGRLRVSVVATGIRSPAELAEDLERSTQASSSSSSGEQQRHRVPEAPSSAAFASAEASLIASSVEAARNTDNADGPVNDIVNEVETILDEKFEADFIVDETTVDAFNSADAKRPHEEKDLTNPELSAHRHQSTGSDTTDKVPSNDGDGAKPTEPNETKKEDVFDIPAFIRKRING